MPDQHHTILVGGYLVRPGVASINDDGYAAAAATADGRVFVAYLPAVRPLTVDLSKLAPGVQAQWFDPTNGTRQSTTGTTVDGSANETFTPPGPNADGAATGCSSCPRPADGDYEAESSRTQSPSSP